MNLAVFLPLLFLSLLLTPATGGAAPMDPDTRPAPAAITEIALERVGAGPRWRDHGWPQDRIVLRPGATGASYPPDEFRDLAGWLKSSGFFSRRSGPRPSPVSDVGYLVITVVRGGHRKQVYSYNGRRDAELWQMEMVIRGAAAAMGLGSARVAWLRKHHHPFP